MATKQMTSPKHPNWIIYKDEVGGKVYWSMQHNDFSGYMIEVWESKGKWVGQILSEQKIEGCPGETDWLPLQSNPFYSRALEDVKAEVIRRGTYWKERISL